MPATGRKRAPPSRPNSIPAPPGFERVARHVWARRLPFGGGTRIHIEPGGLKPSTARGLPILLHGSSRPRPYLFTLPAGAPRAYSRMAARCGFRVMRRFPDGSVTWVWD